MTIDETGKTNGIPSAQGSVPMDGSLEPILPPSGGSSMRDRFGSVDLDGRSSTLSIDGTPTSVRYHEHFLEPFSNIERPETPTEHRDTHASVVAADGKKRKPKDVQDQSKKLLRLGTANSPFAVTAARISPFT